MMHLERAKARMAKAKASAHLYSVIAAKDLDTPKACVHPRQKRRNIPWPRNVKYAKGRATAGRSARAREAANTHPRGVRARACTMGPGGTGPTMVARGEKEKEKGMAKAGKERVAKFLGLERNLMGHGEHQRKQHGQICGEHPPSNNGHRD